MGEIRIRISRYIVHFYVCNNLSLCESMKNCVHNPSRHKRKIPSTVKYETISIYFIFNRNVISPFYVSGFAECVQCMQFLGLVDPNPHPMLHPDGPEVTWVKLN